MLIYYHTVSILIKQEVAQPYVELHQGEKDLFRWSSDQVSINEDGKRSWRRLFCCFFRFADMESVAQLNNASTLVVVYMFNIYI